MLRRSKRKRDDTIDAESERKLAFDRLARLEAEIGGLREAFREVLEVAGEHKSLRRTHERMATQIDTLERRYAALHQELMESTERVSQVARHAQSIAAGSRGGRRTREDTEALEIGRQLLAAMQGPDTLRQFMAELAQVAEQRFGEGSNGGGGAGAVMGMRGA